MLGRTRIAVLVAPLLVLCVSGAPAFSSDARPRAAGEATASLTIGGVAQRRAIPGSFVGLSMEYPAVQAYAGEDPAAVDPVFEQLIRNLAPGQRPVLRIGGDTTDWTWWPIPGLARPPWVRYELTTNWLDVAHTLATDLGARLIPSINLEANSKVVARAEKTALVAGLGPGSIEAFELGNEPELYGSFAWYHTASGRRVTGRPRSYDFAAYAKDFARIAAALGNVALAGPSTGGPAWTRPIPKFVASQPDLGLVTVHRYGLDKCEASDPVPTIPALMSNAAQRGIARSVVGPTMAAHAHRIPLRIEELNAVSCGGQAGVSNTFAAALWALDTLFEAANVGVDGVNIHTRPQGLNSLFTVQDDAGAWQAHVSPEYYGLMLFAQAVPPRSRLLKVSGVAGSRLHVWATRAPGGAEHVVLINEDPSRARVVTLQIPAAHRAGVLEMLAAPSLSATDDVSLGGQGFGSETTTGMLAGARDERSLTPAHHRYTVRLPAASAALLTL